MRLRRRRKLFSYNVGSLQLNPVYLFPKSFSATFEENVRGKRQTENGKRPNSTLISLHLMRFRQTLKYNLLSVHAFTLYNIIYLKLNFLVVPPRTYWRVDPTFPLADLELSYSPSVFVLKKNYLKCKIRKKVFFTNSKLLIHLFFATFDISI